MHRTAEDLIVLLEPHYNSALQYCRGLYKNRKDAEDGLHDAIIGAIQHFKSLRDEAKFRSWFFTIITRTFYKSQRRLAGSNRFFLPLQENHHTLPEVYSDDRLGEREKILLEALDTLNKKERTAILLFEIAGLSLEEIRKIQKGQSISAIKSRLSRARLKLRNSILSMEKIKLKQGDYYDIKSSIPGK